MDFLPPLIQFITAAIISWFFVLLLLPTLSRFFLDVPNKRSSHAIATPRGGGFAFVLVGSVLNFFYADGLYRWIPIICLPLAIVGFVDDFMDLPAIWRYFMQFITASILISISRLSFPAWTFFILVILLTALINFTNFMDGLDGLLAGCGVFLMASISSWSISGSILGFLLWNWNPAKVFMGDVGSTFIGAVLAGMVLQSATYQQAFTILLLGFPLFADPAISVLRRLLNRESIFKPHRRHLYQRLNQAGWGHRQVASLYVASTALLIASNIVGGILLLLISIFLELVLAIFLDQKIAVSFENP